MLSKFYQNFFSETLFIIEVFSKNIVKQTLIQIVTIMSNSSGSKYASNHCINRVLPRDEFLHKNSSKYST